MSKEKQRQFDEINRPRNEELFNNIHKQYQELAKVKTKDEQIEKDELQEFVITLSDCQHRYDKECIKAIVTKSPLPKENKFYAKYLMEQDYRKQRVGEWVAMCRRERCAIKEIFFQCSLCRRIEYRVEPYCHCGAKMKGEKTMKDSVIAFDPCPHCENHDMCSKCELTFRRSGAIANPCEWISVEERLPYAGEDVLVFCDGLIRIDFIGSSGVWYEHAPKQVTHWMPLPEAPKGGGE